MYEQHFGFDESPFSITPDPRFFYANSVYLEAYANLRYGIEAKKGFIAVTGEVGTGKTTLLRKLMLSFDTTVKTVLVFNTDVTFNELLRVILRDLGLPTAGKDRLSMVEELNDYLIEQLEHGRTVCLLIDEVQHLNDESLEGLRLLSNLETDRQKLLQIVLMGQPEVQAKLDQPHLRQLKQRIAIRSELARLRDEEVGSYINFRIQVAGCDNPELFDRYAIEKIALYSRGIPRLINVICDNALVIAFAASKKNVSADVIEEVVRDLRIAPGSQLTDNPTNQAELISELAAGHAIRSSDTPVQIFKRKPVGSLTAIVASLMIVIILGFASLTDPESFFMDASESLNGYQKNLAEWALLVSGQKANPNETVIKVAKAEFQTAEIANKSNDHRITIQNGSTVFRIATDAYGSSAVLGMDLIKEFNPDIPNLNWINAGQDLLLPALNEDTLLRQQPDGSFRLIVASFLSRREAEDFAKRIVRDGLPVIVTVRPVSNNLVLHRLEIDGLKTREEAKQTVQIGFINRWLPFTPNPTIETRAGETRAGQAITGY
jgi:type II secretory pathway predicted ATPase ExeA